MNKPPALEVRELIRFYGDLRSFKTHFGGGNCTGEAPGFGWPSWILVMILVMAPLFIAIYYLMVDTDTPVYRVILVNQDLGMEQDGGSVNLGDSLLHLGQLAFKQRHMRAHRGS